jgi:hypothetical protein
VLVADAVLVHTLGVEETTGARIDERSVQRTGGEGQGGILSQEEHAHGAVRLTLMPMTGGGSAQRGPDMF